MGLQTGDIRPVAIDSLAAGGRGVAREGGLVWFVAGGMPGDRGQAEVIRARGRYVEARLLRLDRPGAERVDAPCRFQSRCGGCPWMALGVAAQRSWKRRLLVDALTRIAGLDAPPVETVREAGPTLAYRNRVEFTVAGGQRGAPVVGLLSSGSDPEAVDVDRCLLQDDAANTVLQTVRRLLLGPAYRPGRRRWRLLVRRSGTSGEIVVGLGTESGPLPGARRLAARLRREHPDLAGVVLYRRRGRSDALWGRAWVRERLAGVDFRVPATSFIQVSATGADELSSVVVELAGPLGGAQALDLYGGIGIHGFSLARAGARRVTVCDIDGAAVRCGREAARGEPAGAVRFVRADVGRWLSGTGDGQRHTDLVVANPPRSGLGAGVAAAVARLGPPRIVLVSCDPATLGRDVKRLVDSGYRLSRVVPVDLFPQTAHVEAVALLDRRR